MTRTLAALGAAMISLAVPAIAQATFPGSNGRIAVIEDYSDRGGEGATDLRLLSSGGAVLNPSLQHCAFHEFEDLPDERNCPGGPSFSRDGTKLVFTVDQRLAVANDDGTGRVLLPHLTARDTEPAWTPDGKILFTGKALGKENLYLVGADGTGLTQITHRGGHTAAVSKTGRIAYVNGDFVRLLRADGTHGRRLARGSNPDFSPSGKTVVYDRNDDLYRKRVKPGGKRHLVTRNGIFPVYSPSGKRVLFVRFNEISSIKLLTIKPTGGSLDRIYRAPTAESAVTNLFEPAWQALP